MGTPAGSALMGEIVNKYLSCFLCEKDFTNPVQLPCGHTFCRECILNQFTKKQPDSGYLTCSVCNQPIHLPENGADGFPAHTSIHSLRMRHASGDKSSSIRCSQHPEKTLVFYCRTCDMPICENCRLIDAHSSHSCVDLQETLKEVEKGMATSVHMLEYTAKSFNFNRRKLQHIKNDLQYQTDTTAAAVRMRADYMRQVVDAVEADMLAKLGDTRQKHEQQVDDWLKREDQSLRQVEEATADAVSLSQQGQNVQVLTLHRVVSAHLDKLKQKACPSRESAQLALWTSMTFDKPDREKAQMAVKEGFGVIQVEYPSVRHLADYRVDGDVSALTVIGNHTVVCFREQKSVKMYSQDGQLLDEFELENFEPWDVKARGNELYISDYSSDRVRVYTKEGEEYTLKGAMKLKESQLNKGAKYVAVDKKGNVFVASPDASRVNVYNQRKEIEKVLIQQRFGSVKYAGMHLATLGMSSLYFSTNNRDLWTPNYLDTSHSGRLLVSCSNPGRLYVFKPGGEELFQYDLNEVSGVAADMFENVVVAQCMEKGQVHLVSGAGYQLKVLVKEGALSWPRAVTFDQDGNLLVSHQGPDGPTISKFAYAYSP